MPRSYWLPYVAFGVVLSLSAPIYGQTQLEAPVGQSEQQNPQKRPDEKPAETPPTAQKQKRPTHYQQPCDQPQSRADHDLCQQWRMAEATEKLLNRTEWQLGGTAFEIFLIVAAIGIAGYAGYQAWRTAEIADRTAKHQLRAYITLESLAMVPPVGQNRYWQFIPQWKNTGQTPAHRVVMNTNHEFFGENDGNPEIKKFPPGGDLSQSKSPAATLTASMLSISPPIYGGLSNIMTFFPSLRAVGQSSATRSLFPEHPVGLKM